VRQIEQGALEKMRVLAARPGRLRPV
jgi:DNA-directed RNA polymerase sigma subunit (sigma70/sigma32)